MLGLAVANEQQELLVVLESRHGKLARPLQDQHRSGAIKRDAAGNLEFWWRRA
jgi:hypothetical protein